jgi:serine/threonine protein kinase
MTKLQDVSQACQELLQGLLIYCPAERLSATQALSHPWFRNMVSEPLFIWPVATTEPRIRLLPLELVKPIIAQESKLDNKSTSQRPIKPQYNPKSQSSLVLPPLNTAPDKRYAQKRTAQVKIKCLCKFHGYNSAKLGNLKLSLDQKFRVKPMYLPNRAM